MTTTAPAWLPHWTAHANTPAHLRLPGFPAPLLDWLGEQGSEDVYHAILDAHPDAHDVRRALGLWLAEKGDERGEGYRALAACERKPEEWVAAGQWYWLRVCPFNGIKHPEELPDRWFDLLPPPHQYGKDQYTKAWPYGEESNTRRAAEDAAALAFARLPAARRAALLRGELEG